MEQRVSRGFNNIIELDQISLHPTQSGTGTGLCRVHTGSLLRR